MRRNTLANPLIAYQFWKWLRKHIEDSDILDHIDSEEFGSDLTLSEAKMMVERKFPGILKGEGPPRVKQIVLMRMLIEKMVEGDAPECTYRPWPLSGLYYIRCSRFHRCRHQPPCPQDLVVEVYQTEQVDTRSLTDKDAQLAGISDQETLFNLFTRWYGQVPQKMYRNWFRLKGQG